MAPTFELDQATQPINQMNVVKCFLELKKKQKNVDDNIIIALYIIACS